MKDAIVKKEGSCEEWEITVRTERGVEQVPKTASEDAAFERSGDEVEVRVKKENIAEEQVQEIDSEGDSVTLKAMYESLQELCKRVAVLEEKYELTGRIHGQSLMLIREELSILNGRRKPVTALPSGVFPKFPIKTMPQFDELEAILQDQAKRNMFVDYIERFGKGGSDFAVVHCVMKKIMSAELMKLFSFKGLRKGKKAFIETNVWSSVLEIAKKSPQTTNTKMSQINAHIEYTLIRAHEVVTKGAHS